MITLSESLPGFFTAGSRLEQHVRRSASPTGESLTRAPWAVVTHGQPASS